MLKKLTLASAILLTSSTVAFADNMVPYLGVDVGYDSSHFKLKDVTGVSQSSNSNGWFGNLAGGLGWSFEPRFYLGLEAFGLYSSVASSTKVINTASGPSNARLRLKYSYGISALPGFKFTDSTMMYLRAGLVRSRFDLHQDLPPATASSNWSKNTVSGGQLGIGLSIAQGNKWSERIEYTYSQYRSFNAFGNTIRFYDNQFKVGVAYNFC